MFMARIDTIYLIIISAGVPASLEDAMRNAVADVLDRRLEDISRTLDKLKSMKDDVRIMKEDVRIMKEGIRQLTIDVALVGRTAALVSFHSNYTR